MRRDDSGGRERIFGIIQDITERKRAEAEVRASEQRYRYIFQSTGVSIWEEDLSQIRDAIEDLKARGVRDFREYCADHPEFVEQAISMVKVVDVNDATLELFMAESKEELLASVRDVFLPETLQVFVGELIAIAEGRTSQLSMAIEGARRQGMQPLNDALAGLVQSGSVDVREAYRRAADRGGFLALLKRLGMDTALIERVG